MLVGRITFSSSPQILPMSKLDCIIRDEKCDFKWHYSSNDRKIAMDWYQKHCFPELYKILIESFSWS